MKKGRKKARPAAGPAGDLSRGPLTARRSRAPAQPARAGRDVPLPPDFDSFDLHGLGSRLRERRLLLGETIRSSKEYFSSVNRVLELRSALARAEGRFRELYDFIPVPFLVLDGTLNIVSANAAAVELCGSHKVAVGRNLSELLESNSVHHVAEVLRDGPRGPVEVRLRTAGGPVRAQLTAQAVDRDPEWGARGAAARRVYYVAIVDVSNVRRLEDERVLLDRERRLSQDAERAAREGERAKDDFIAILSHELRTPLTPVLAAVGTIRAEPLPASVREAIAIIRRNVDAEARLIDDLLDVARIRQGRLVVEREPLALHDLLTQVLVDWQPEAARRGLSVELAREARADVVSADRDRIAQVLRNVLGNATKFTDPGGRVTVRTRGADGRIRVTVTDTGSGMSEEELEHLFQAFAAARPRRPAHGRAGLGLGLAISRGIVEAHGGRMRATSPGPGQGTTVEMELDLVPGGLPTEALPPGQNFAALPPPRLSAPPPSNGEKPRVLLVEDHEDSAATLSMVLSIKGYRVQVARTVAEARDMVASCDVLVSDISLPDGSGLDLLRQIRQKRDVKAIAVSGYGTEDDVQRSAEAGFAEHLVKPFDPDRLVEMLERLAATSVRG